MGIADNRVRLAIIGVGKHARANVLPVLYRLDADIVAVCDLDEAQAREVARQYRIPKAYSDHRAMISDAAPDAVVLVTGPQGHATLAVELMKAGIDVYVEKPTAPSLDAAISMLRAKEETDRICMTAFKKRYAPAYTKAKTLIESPAFGKKGVLSLMRSTGSASKEPKVDIDQLLGWTCHVLDLGYYLWGQVDTVTTTTISIGNKYTWSVSMRHLDGSLSNQVLSNFPGCEGETLSLFGDGGIVIEVENSINMLATKNREPIEIHTPAFSKGHAFSDIEQGFAGELIGFIAAIRSRAEPEGNIRQSCHTMAIFEAMCESAKNGGTAKVRFQP